MGKMVITTEFSVYDVDLEAMHVVRRPAGGTLRRDGEVIPLIEMTRPRIGEPVVFALDLRGDDVVTIRTTSPVVAIDENVSETS